MSKRMNALTLYEDMNDLVPHGRRDCSGGVMLSVNFPSVRNQQFGKKACLADRLSAMDAGNYPIDQVEVVHALINDQTIGAPNPLSAMRASDFALAGGAHVRRISIVEEVKRSHGKALSRKWRLKLVVFLINIIRCAC